MQGRLGAAVTGEQNRALPDPAAPRPVAHHGAPHAARPSLASVACLGPWTRPTQQAWEEPVSLDPGWTRTLRESQLPGTFLGHLGDGVLLEEAGAPHPIPPRGPGVTACWGGRRRSLSDQDRRHRVPRPQPAALPADGAIAEPRQHACPAPSPLRSREAEPRRMESLFAMSFGRRSPNWGSGRASRKM